MAKTTMMIDKKLSEDITKIKILFGYKTKDSLIKEALTPWLRKMELLVCSNKSIIRREKWPVLKK